MVNLLDWTTLAAAFMEGMYFGAFTILFVFTIYALVYQRNGHINKFLLTASVLMYVLATAHMGIVIFRAVTTLLIAEEQPGGAMAFLTKPSASVIAKSALYATQTVLGDSCMIYRCFVVWQHRIWTIAVPLIFVATCAVSGYGAIVQYTNATNTAHTFAYSHWIDIFVPMSLATNVYCTVMVILRIWAVERACCEHRQSRNTLKPIVIVVMESGVIYSICLLALFAAYLANRWYYVFLDTLTPIIGITFCLIITRTGLRFEFPDHGQGKLSTPTRLVLGTRAGSAKVDDNDILDITR